MKSFSELFINKIFEFTFVTFECEQTICKKARVTSLEEVSLAEFIGEYTRPKIYETTMKTWLDLVSKVEIWTDL